MGDLTFAAPPATTTNTPAAAAAVPEPSSSAGPAPRCRRVRFPDQLVASPIWLPPSPLPAANEHAAAEGADPSSGPEKETGAAADVELEDRMDLLWEDFNEELLAMRRAGGGPGPCSSDGEASDSAPGRIPVLRQAARAVGAGHYRRRAGSWVLLVRIFRRFFVIDKTIAPVASTRRRAINSSSR
jgi:hypothetical protein